jgi:hypothetical protein
VGKEASAGAPALLEIDPLNENCQPNTLEWDAGKLKSG